MARWVGIVIHRAELAAEIARNATEHGRRAGAEELVTVRWCATSSEGSRPRAASSSPPCSRAIRSASPATSPPTRKRAGARASRSRFPRWTVMGIRHEYVSAGKECRRNVRALSLYSQSKQSRDKIH